MKVAAAPQEKRHLCSLSYFHSRGWPSLWLGPVRLVARGTVQASINRAVRSWLYLLGTFGEFLSDSLTPSFLRRRLSSESHASDLFAHRAMFREVPAALRPYFERTDGE